MSTIGASWFDAFRDNGGPVLYNSMNRTPAIEDYRNILLYISFSTLFLAFLIIFPGIRKERFSTFICVTTSLFIGAVILLSNCGTHWHIAEGSIAGPYRAFSREKIFANVGVNIGLDSVNITLRASPIHHKYHLDINYNERFYWIAANQMKQEFQRALTKGLPYPILTIAEYLSQDGEGFNWGRQYRMAGYYTSVTLWFAFASWILMIILLCAVPRYGAYTMQLTGILMLFSNLLYTCMIPANGLRIPFEGAVLTFTYGRCFWMVFTAGITAIIIGATVSIVDILFPNKFSTILEVDYDTPYRYFVGNDSHIVGSLPPPMSAYYSYQSPDSLSNSGKYQKKHNGPGNMGSSKHISASKTASVATDSTCCAGSGHRSLAKTKSDVSTCTRDLNSKTFICTADIENTMLNYELDEADKDNNNIVMLHHKKSSQPTTNNDTNGNANQISDYELHDLGHENAAYQSTESETTFQNRDQDIKQSRPKLSPKKSSVSRTSEEGSSGLDSGSEESDVSTTYIDGKQAVSLSNFSKFTEQQQRKESKANGGFVNAQRMGPTFGYQMASAGYRSNKPLTRRIASQPQTQQQQQQQSTSQRNKSKSDAKQSSTQASDNANLQQQQSSSHTVKIDLSDAAIW